MNTRIDPETAGGLELPAPAGAGERNYFRRDLFASIAVIAAIAFGMEAWSWAAPVYIMPSIVLTGAEILTILGEDYIHIVITILRLLVAVAFSLVAGSLVGVAMGIVRPAEPFIKALSTDLVEVVEAFRPSRWQVFRLLILPHIVPYILMTAKSIIGYAARMTAFAEPVSVNTGMGARMGLDQDELNMQGVDHPAGDRQSRRPGDRRMGREAAAQMAARGLGPMTAEGARTVIGLDRVDRYFGAHPAVLDLSFEVMEGEIDALLGRTGAGKSTALHMIMGVLEPTGGTVRVEGLDPYAQFKALRGKLAVSFQNDRLLPWRSAWENVSLGLEILGFDRETRRSRAIEWLENVKIAGEENIRKYPHELSGGMRPRVSLARALCVDPALVLLDESFSQLDHVTSKALRADFTELVRRLGKTCVLIAHRIDDALEMADRILVLAAPAKLALKVRVTRAGREEPGWLETQHAAIAAAMGGEDDVEAA